VIVGQAGIAGPDQLVGAAGAEERRRKAHQTAGLCKIEHRSRTLKQPWVAAKTVGQGLGKNLVHTLRNADERGGTVTPRVALEQQRRWLPGRLRHSAARKERQGRRDQNGSTRGQR
jgi:hypothetical protein